MPEKGQDKSVDWKQFDGSLKDDKAVEAHKIADDDERWQLLDSSGGVKKITLRPGNNHTKAEKGDVISVNYTIFNRKTGEMLETTRPTEKSQVKEEGTARKIEYGKSPLTKGWEIALGTMTSDERALVRCSPEFAYGKKGDEGRIPGDTTLDCIIEIDDMTTWEEIGDSRFIWKKSIREMGDDMWNHAKEHCTVTVTYIGREVNIDGRVWTEGVEEVITIPFDLEFEGEGTTPEYEQPRGFYICLQEINMGETVYCKLKCREAYTFGIKGSEKHKIARGTDLWYEITVIKIDFYEMNRYELDRQTQIPRALEIKDMANNFFRKKKFLIANDLYKLVVEILEEITDPTDEEKESMKETRISCYSNRALVEMKLRNFESCEQQIDKGLALDPMNEKLHYRRALLGYEQCDFLETESVIDKLIEDFPDNKPARALKVKNLKDGKIYREKSKKLAKKMFADMKKTMSELNQETWSD